VVRASPAGIGEDESSRALRTHKCRNRRRSFRIVSYLDGVWGVWSVGWRGVVVVVWRIWRRFAVVARLWERLEPR